MNPTLRPQIAAVHCWCALLLASDARYLRLMPARSSPHRPQDELVGFDVERELARVFGDGVRPLRFEEALFDVMLAGWVRQQRARLLSAGTIGPRARLVRRLQTHAGTWPWEWRAEQLEEWIEDLSLPRPLRSIGTKSHDKDRGGGRRGRGRQWLRRGGSSSPVTSATAAGPGLT